MRNTAIRKHLLLLALMAAISCSVAACSALGTAGTMPASSEADRRYLAKIALLRWNAEQARLYLVSSRVFDAALRSGKCEATKPFMGFLLDSEQALPSHLREEADALGLQSGEPRIIAVVPGGPAADAGLVPGDRVLATTGSHPEGVDQLHIRRGERELSVPLTARLACAYTVQLEPDTEIGAYGTFSGIHVTYGQARAFPDDAMLAFVVGHEVGHFVSGHVTTRAGVLGSTVAIDLAITKGLLTIASQLALRPLWRREELEADQVGLLLARRAGYDPDRILQAWPTYAAVAPGRVQRGWFGDHPGMAERYSALSAILSGQAEQTQKSK